MALGHFAHLKRTDFVVRRRQFAAWLGLRSKVKPLRKRLLFRLLIECCLANPPYSKLVVTRLFHAR